MAQKQSVLILCLINLSTVARNIGRDYSLVFGRLPTLPKSASHRKHITDSWPTIKLAKKSLCGDWMTDISIQCRRLAKDWGERFQIFRPIQSKHSLIQAPIHSHTHIHTKHPMWLKSQWDLSMIIMMCDRHSIGYITLFLFKYRKRTLLMLSRYSYAGFCTCSVT